MADLTDLQAAQTIKIAGADSSGTENNYVNASVNGDLSTVSVMNVSAVATSLTVTTTAVEMKVGASNLANRKLLVIEAQAAGYVWGVSSGSQPFSLPNGSPLTLQVGPNISIWVRKVTGTNTVAVAEFS